MAKRFTDTDKWRDEWFALLSNDYRMVWLYLIDSCSIAGIWKKDFRGLNFNCNTNITEEEFLKVFGSRLVDRGKFFFIPKFVRFQCPKGLNSNKPAIVSIVKELKQNNLTEIIQELYGNDYLIIKDKDKGKGKDKGEGTGKDKYITIADEKIFDVMPILEFYEASLNGRQKEQGIGSWKVAVPDWFEQNLKMEFNDKRHVMNSFSRYMMNQIRAPGKSGKVDVPKLTLQDLQQ